MINLIIVGEMEIYLIVYGGGLLPPRKSKKTELLSGAIKLENICDRRDNPCGCP